MESKTSTPPDFAIRRATRSDVPELTRLEEELFGPGAWPHEVVSAEVRGSNRRYLVATARSIGPVGTDAIERVIGYGGIALGDVSEVMTVGVTREVRGRGAGRALLQELISESISNGRSEIFLEVRVDNVGAIALYRSLGFTDVRIRRAYYQPENIDALVMRRK